MLIEDNYDRKSVLVFLLLDHFGEVVGRTRVQKLLYLANITGWNEIRDYVFYQYGPYSEWLKREFDVLVQNDLIYEDKEYLDEDKTLYKYRLTDAGKEILNRKLQEIDNTLIINTRKLFETFRNISIDDLEIMASLVFLRKSNPEFLDDRLVSLIQLYKPRFSSEKIRNSLQVFRMLNDSIA